MKKLLPKLAASALAAALVLGLAGCGGTTGGSSTPAASPATSSAASGSQPSGGEEVSITILNTKPELETQFAEMAARYTEETGVQVETFYTSDVVSTHLASRYASANPYTLMMVDHPDVFDFEQYLLDLSGEDWMKDGGAEYGVAVDGKTYAFPFTMESVGLLYNADAIKGVTGEDFDWTRYTTPAAFQALLDELVAGGMEHPVAVNKETWSLANHFFGQLYDQQGNSADGSEAYVQSLIKGEVDLAADARYTSLMDAFDLLAKYNINSADPLAAEYDLNNSYFAEGEVAFWFNGSWANAIYDTYENFGMMPLPQADDTDKADTLLVMGASKQFVIDKEYNTEAQQQAAKDFLNWLVYDAEGQKFLVEDCGCIPAFSNIDLQVDLALGASAQGFAKDGQTMYWYQEIPGDHGDAVGASLQKYLAGQTDRAGLAGEVQDYWAKQA